jgi:hypothetical protein
MEALTELRTVVLHADLIGRHSLLLATVLQLAAHLLTVGDGVRVRVDYVDTPGCQSCGAGATARGFLFDPRPRRTPHLMPLHRHWLRHPP